MPALSVKLRRALIAIGVGVAFLTVCVVTSDAEHKTSNNGPQPAAQPPPNSAPSAAPPPQPPPAAKDYVEGMVRSVSGNAIALRTRTGSATVDYAAATRVVEVTPASLTDVTPGSCVNVRATPQSAPAAGAITAQSVTVTAAADGKCPPPAGFYGTVSSVSGNTIAVTGLGPGGPAAPTNVTVAKNTSYQRQTPSDPHAIADGKCLGAQGTQDGGVLNAAMISLETCPPMGHPHHHLHLPHLPFRI